MAQRAFVLALGGGILVCLAAGCPNSGPGDAPPPLGDSGATDAGGAPIDGAAMDGAPDDSGTNDAAVAECVAETPFVLGIDSRLRERRVAVAPRSDEFLVTWNELRDGFEEIFVRVMPTSGEPASDVPITDDTAISDLPNAIATDDGWLVVWRDNTLGTYELQARAIDSEGQPVGSANRVTTSSDAESEPVLARSQDAFLVGWLATDSDASERRFYVSAISETGVPSGSSISLTTPPIAPETPALTSIEDGFAAFWFQQSGAGENDAMLRLLTSEGTAAGTAEALSTESNAAAGVDITTGLCTLCEGSEVETAAGAFAVLLNGSARAVRFRRIDTQGEPASNERTVNESSENAFNPSVAAFAGGFIVTYRTSTGTPRIRAALVTTEGDVSYRFDVAEAESSGGPTTVRVSGDGTPMVAWADIGSEGTTMRAARIACDD